MHDGGRITRQTDGGGDRMKSVSGGFPCKFNEKD